LKALTRKRASLGIYVDALHVAVDANHGRHTGRKVQIGRVILDGERQQLGNIDGH
jgi:hypothetical protein